MNVVTPLREQFLTAEQVADVFGITVPGAQWLFRTGKLPAVKFGKRWYVRPEAVTGLIEAAEREAKRKASAA